MKDFIEEIRKEARVMDGLPALMKAKHAEKVLKMLIFTVDEQQKQLEELKSGNKNK